MKTAMQLMLDDLLSKRDVYQNAKIYQCLATLETSIGVAKFLLIKEKEQIKDAFDAGQSEGQNADMGVQDYNGDFINYYEQTFNQNK